MEHESVASAVLTDLGVLVDDLGAAQARVASAFAAETHFFANVVNLVQRREAERACREDSGARVSASQLAMREVYAEIGAALRLSEYQVAARVNQAHQLMTGFLETMYEVSDGTLSPRHAQAIADTGGGLTDPAVRGEYERLALDLAGELTAAQLKAALGGVVDRLDPDGTQQRIRAAVAQRGVRRRSLQPGLGQLIITAPTAQVEGAYNRLTDIATELHTDNQADAARHATAQTAGAGDLAGAGDDASHATARGIDGDDSGLVADERTRPQLMADVALDLLLTSAAAGHGTTPAQRDRLGGIVATVNITIPAGTLTGTAVGGAEVVGAGLIDDDTARRLAGTSDTWYRMFIDPTTGTPVTVDRRRPTTAQKRLLRARDEHCRFPGCRRPARRCDIDHQVPWAEGGPTSLHNLAHLCERHHTLKHHSDWDVQQRPGGRMHWTSPTRLTHITRPPGAVRFVPDRAPGAGRFLPDRPPGAVQFVPDSGLPAPF